MSRFRVDEEFRQVLGRVLVPASGLTVQAVQPGTTTPHTIYQAATGPSTQPALALSALGGVVGTAGGGELWADEADGAGELRLLNGASEVLRKRFEPVTSATLTDHGSRLGTVESGFAAGAITPTAGRAGGVAAPVLRDFVSTKDFGSKHDGNIVTDAAITSGQATLTSSQAAFTTADAGKKIAVIGAGAAGAVLVATISSVAGGVATLSASASTTVTGATAHYGTDDSATDQATVTAVASLPRGGTAFKPPGHSYYSQPVVPPSNVTISGDGAVILMSGVATVGGKKAAVTATGTLGTKYTLTADALPQRFIAQASSADVTSLVGAGLKKGSLVLVFAQGSLYASAQADIGRGEALVVADVNTGTGVLTFETAVQDTYLAGKQLALITPVSNLTFRGLKFIGSESIASERGISLTYCDDYTIDGCRFRNIDLMCLELTSCTDGMVIACRFKGTWYDGITGSNFYAICAFNATQWLEIVECTANRCRHLYVNSGYSDSPTGTLFGEPADVTLVACVMINAMANGAGDSYAYEHHGVGRNIVLDSCVADSCGYGLSIKGPGISVYNFRCLNWNDGVIAFGSVTTLLEDVLIEGVVFGPPTAPGGVYGGGGAPKVIDFQVSDAAVFKLVKIADVRGTADFSVCYGFYHNSARTTTVTGDVTNASAVISNVSDTSRVAPGQLVSGTGIPAGATVLERTATSIRMSANATSTSAGATVTLTGVVQSFELADFNMRHVGPDPLATRTALIYLNLLENVRVKRLKAANVQSLVYSAGNDVIVDQAEQENSTTATAGIGVRFLGQRCKVRRSDLHAFTPVRYDSAATGGSVAHSFLWSDSGTYIQDLTTGAATVKDFNEASLDGAAWTVLTGGLPDQFWSPRKSSNCSTLPRQVGTASVSLASGFVYGALAIEDVGSTYTKIRFCTGATVTTLTAIRLGIADASGVAMQSTADLVGTVTTANTLYDNIALAAAVTTVRGVSYFPCIGWTGTTLTVSGVAGRAAAMFGAIGIGPALQRGASGYTTGALPNLSSVANTPNMPWIEMVP